jgi:hypothetical protein
VASELIGRLPATTSPRAASAERTRSALPGLLQPNTIVASFDSPSDATVAMGAAMRLRGVAGVRHFHGVNIAPDLSGHWSERSFVGRVLSLNDEVRLVEQVTCDLEAGRSVIAVTAADPKAALELLSAASRVFSVGLRTFECLR